MEKFRRKGKGKSLCLDIERRWHLGSNRGCQAQEAWGDERGAQGFGSSGPADPGAWRD